MNSRTRKFAVRRKHLIVIFAAGLAAFGCIGFALYGPAYLDYADAPARSDVIVLLLGPEFDSRAQEALSLISEGYARKVIVPDCHAVVETPTVEELNRLRGSAREMERRGEFPERKSPVFFESTHFEILTAVEMMKNMGFTSAILVSSSYHMRRIKLISQREMGPSGIRVLLVPARFEVCTYGYGHYYLTTICEYVKIAWFLAYGYFC